MSAWVLPAILCLVAWGCSRFLPKLATRYIDPQSAFIYEVSGEMLVALVMLVAIGFKPMFHAKGVSLAMLAGVLGGIGVYAYLLAAQRGNVSQLVTLTALYPVVTVMLGYFLLDEAISIRQGIGMVLALIAVILVAA